MGWFEKVYLPSQACVGGLVPGSMGCFGLSAVAGQVLACCTIARHPHPCCTTWGIHNLAWAQHGLRAALDCNSDPGRVS